MNFGTLNQAYPGGWTADNGVKIWMPSANAFQTYVPGVNSNGDTVPCWGPEAEFVRLRRSRRPGVARNLVKHTLGGCGLAKKSGSPDFNVHSSGKEWDAAYTKIVAALNALIAAGTQPILDSVFIAIGETDTFVQADADAFAENLSEFLLALRMRTWCHNTRAVIMRPFPNSTQGSYLNAVRAGVAQVGGYYRNAWVDTDDLTEATGFTGAAGHLDCASVVTLGARWDSADLAIDP